MGWPATAAACKEQRAMAIARVRIRSLCKDAKASDSLSVAFKSSSPKLSQAERLYARRSKIADTHPAVPSAGKKIAQHL